MPRLAALRRWSLTRPERAPLVGLTLVTCEETDDYPVASAEPMEPLCASVAVGHTFIVDLPTVGRTTFGRDDAAAVPLPLKSISRLHLEISRRGGVVEVRDLGSRNGTLVNGQPLHGPRRVDKGDVISLGSAQVTLLSARAVPTRIQVLRTRAAFVEAVDREIRAGREVRVVAATVPTCWCDMAALYTFLGGLPNSVAVGILDTQSLALLMDGAAPWSGAALKEVHAEARVGEATTRSFPAVNGEGLVRAAVRARSEVPVATEPAAACSAAMRTLFDEALRLARSRAAVMLVGERGVGKEYVARAIHDGSGRGGPFVSVAAARAFGGEGALDPALAAAAAGGTLFLDEIGDVPLAKQPRVLRLLDELAPGPVPAARARHVRVISSTSRNLHGADARASFREDLLYRLAACTLYVPPLRDRVADFEALAVEILADVTARMSPPRAPPSIALETVRLLQTYDWPGNLRQLRHVLEGAVAGVAMGNALTARHLPPEILSVAGERGAVPATDARAEMDRYERKRISDALVRCHGNVRKASALLGLPPRTLAYKMARLGMTVRPRQD